MAEFELDAYLRRIGLTRPAPTAESLAALQRAQLQAIPFEDLDPFLGAIPAVALPEVADKLLRAGRGGYCFELNTLFHAALKALGFDVARRMARVRRGPDETGARSHLTLIVTIGTRRYLADTGFGGPGAFLPLDIDSEAPQDAGNAVYRIVPKPETDERELQRQDSGGWRPLYGFDQAHVCDADIVAANHLCATWDGAPFSSHLMISRYTPEGRIGIFDMTMTLQTATSETRRDFKSQEDFAEVLTELAGIVADAATLRRAWDKLTA